MGKFIIGLVGLLVVAGQAGATDELDAGEVAARVEALRSRALASIVEREHYVLRIGDELRIAGVELCPDDKRLVWGVVTATEYERIGLGLAPLKSRREASHGVAVLAVEPRSPADRAGISPGDVIERLDGKPLKKSTDLYRRVRNTERESVEVTVRRGAEKRVVSMPLVLGCFTGVGLWHSSSVNAFMIHEGIFVSSGILRFANDDEIAVVIGHEFGHGILKTGNKPHYEADADYLGLYLAARAGYDIEVAPGFWKRMAVRSPSGLIDSKNIGFRTHPRNPARTLALEATIREIREKQTGGLSLAPEVPE